MVMAHGAAVVGRVPQQGSSVGRLLVGGSGFCARALATAGVEALGAVVVWP